MEAQSFPGLVPAALIQHCRGCGILGSAQGQTGWVSEQPVLVGRVPAHGRGLEQDELEVPSGSNQSVILSFSDLEPFPGMFLKGEISLGIYPCVMGVSRAVMY